MAVGKFAGQRRAVENTLAYDLARLAGGFTCLGGKHCLLDYLASGLRMFLKIARQLFADGVFDDSLDVTGYQLGFCLGIERGVGMFDMNDANHPFSRVLP